MKKCMISIIWAALVLIINGCTNNENISGDMSSNYQVMNETTLSDEESNFEKDNIDINKDLELSFNEIEDLEKPDINMSLSQGNLYMCQK